MDSAATHSGQHSSDPEGSPEIAGASWPPGPPPMMEFWKKYPGLVWSNRNAPDAVRIRAALLKPRFSVLLDIAATFGLERLEQEWAVLCAEHDSETRRAEREVTRILRNLRRGYEQARA